jgi:DNA-binding transcriptional LysR family regulator
MHWADRIGRRLKLRDLHTLLTVVQCQSMAKAARQLAVSNPVVSKTIADLEHTLGVRLLDRNSQGVEPTIYAQALLDRSIVVFDELRQAVRHVEYLADPASGEVRVATSAGIGSNFCSAVIDRLARQHPRIVVHVLIGVSPAMYRDLEQRQADLVIERLFAPVAEPNMHAETLYHQPFVVAAGVRSQCAKRRKVALGDLMEEVWALPALDTNAGQLVADAFRANGLSFPRPTLVVNNDPIRRVLVATGRFVSIIPAPLLIVAASPALKVLPIELPTTRRPIAVVTLRNRTVSPVAQVFIECAREVAKSLNKTKQHQQ